MKCRNFILILVGLLLCPAALKAQALSNDSEKKARDLLREVIESRERAKAQAQTPAPNVQAPVVQNPAVSAPPVIQVPPANLPPIITKPARENQNLAPTGARANARQPNYSELESLYLNGKITARQFQQYLRDHTDPLPAATASTRPLPPVYTKDQPPTSATASPPNKPAEVASIASTPAPAPVELKPENAQPTTEQVTLSEMEKKMDELFKLKAAREQAASQAATNTVDSAKPKTKRERMDQLLKLYIAGKVTETEYKARRDQLIAEPEPK